jgi:hypothetical protein
MLSRVMDWWWHVRSDARRRWSDDLLLLGLRQLLTLDWWCDLGRVDLFLLFGLLSRVEDLGLGDFSGRLVELVLRLVNNWDLRDGRAPHDRLCILVAHSLVQSLRGCLLVVRLSARELSLSASEVRLALRYLLLMNWRGDDLLCTAAACCPVEGHGLLLSVAEVGRDRVVDLG